jgi:hypothetical protein
MHPQESHCIVGQKINNVARQKWWELLYEFENEPQIYNSCQKFQWIYVQTVCFGIQGFLFVLIDVLHFES